MTGADSKSEESYVSCYLVQFLCKAYSFQRKRQFHQILLRRLSTHLGLDNNLTPFGHCPPPLQQLPKDVATALKTLVSKSQEWRRRETLAGSLQWKNF